MKYYKDKYRNESLRLKNWNYANDGLYFITICSANREHYFGRVENKKMLTNQMGRTVKLIWTLIPNQFNYALLDEFVVMPNHVHGIIILKDARSDAINRVTTEKIRGGITHKHNPMLQNNLSRIIRWFKGRATYEIRKSGCDFYWQPRFYEHIIRNERALNNIRWYIRKNPKMWDNDQYNRQVTGDGI